MLNKLILLRCIFGKGISAGERQAEATKRPLDNIVPDVALNEAIDNLPPRHKFVIEHRFSTPIMTLKDVALITPRHKGGVGVIPERVRQIEAKSLRLLYRALREYVEAEQE